MKNRELLSRVLFTIKKEAVLVIAAAVAVVSMFFVKPTTKYLEYIDFRVLSLLFCLMTVVAGLQKNGVFLDLSKKLLCFVKTTRSLCYILILLCFFSSMWITNDVALITFVPFAILMLHVTKQDKYIIYTIVMQTIAANLGSLLTPVGNPQNLYLYSFYQIDSIEFFQITVPITLVSFIIISVISLFVKSENIMLNQNLDKNRYRNDTDIRKKKIHIIIYIILFLICLATVLRILDYRFTFFLVVLTLMGIDKSIFHRVDYSLLLTFVSFFIFVGNLEQIHYIRDMITDIIQTRETIAAILLSQIISNVPSAVLLSNFTESYQSLLIGTNMGGLGTIIASLASLISFKYYCKTEQAKPLRYLGIFSLYNISILILLYVVLQFILV